MKKVEEFDWDWTRRKVIVTMPYYGNRLRQVSYALKNIHTSLEDHEWGVLVGDDGCDHDISELENIKNVKVIKVRNAQATERNGCLCRNVLIKRCQSEWVISVDPEIHWKGDFFKTICDHPKHIVRTGNTRNVSVHSIESVLSGKVGIDDLNYRVFNNFSPTDPINEDSVVVIDPSNQYMMGTWGVHYGLALETKSWHALRGYNEKIVDYGPDDGDMMERALKMMDNSFLRTTKLGKKGKIIEIEPPRDPIYLYDIYQTKGMITNFHIASDIYATHLYHDRLTGPINFFEEETSKPGFIRNRDIEWGMSYDK